MWEKEEVKGSVLFFFFLTQNVSKRASKCWRGLHSRKTKKRRLRTIRLFRARIASREIIFRVNLRETCEKHIEECVSIGFERVLERCNVVECGLRFLFFLNRSILMQSSPTHAAITHFFQEQNRASRSSQCHDTKRKENENKNALCQ